MTTAVNHLIELLPRKDQQRLLKLAQPVRLAQSHVLGETGAPTRFVYFPLDGFISDVIAQSLIGALPTFFTHFMTLSDQESALVSRARVRLYPSLSRHGAAIGTAREVNGSKQRMHVNEQNRDSNAD